MKKSIIETLNERYASLNYEEYIKSDSIQVVRKMYEDGRNIDDVELCAILTAVVSWGNKKDMIEAAYSMMNMCDWKPAEFIKLGEFYDISDEQHIYKTLRGKGFKDMCHELRLFYNNQGSIQEFLQKHTNIPIDDLLLALCRWGESARLGNPYKNSSCVRICRLLRWMVRKDNVDLGLWQTESISPAKLYAVIDGDVAKVVKEAGVMQNPKSSWKAVLELTYHYKNWDRTDPLKYDLVLTNDF